MRLVPCILAAFLPLLAPLRAFAAADDAPSDKVARLSFEPQDRPAPRFYAGAEYLLWWVKGAPLSVPLISTGPIATTHHGWVNHADSTILYGASHSPAQGGNDTQEFHGFSGTRATLGYWLDSKRRFALEATGFLLERRSAGYSIFSDESGNPVINIPVFNTISYTPGGRPGGLPPSEDGLPASLPSDPQRFDGNSGIFSGGVSVTNTLQLWGADLTAVAVLYQSPSFELAGLGGFRYLDLVEKFNLTYVSTGETGIYAGRSGEAWDNFNTRNHFFGGTLGLRGRYTYGPLSLEISGRVGLGVSHEILDINGGFVSFNNLILASSGPEGVFAMPANEGRTTSNRFAVVPEAQIKLAYALTTRLSVTARYDFLFYSSVVRPGDQIDRNIPKGQTFLQGGNTVSTTSPARFFNPTSFYAHGVSFGLELSF